MKIIAWNVNGLRSLLKKKYLNDLIENENPDIFWMGETKLSCPYNLTDTTLSIKFPQFKYKYWSHCKEKKGYSGTSIFCKKEPLSIQYGLKFKEKEIDDEGRVIVIEYMFGLPGIGSLAIESAFKRDYAIIQAVALTIIGLFILTTLLFDIVCGLVDPRLRLSKERQLEV
jgi:exonuclease III